MPFTYIWALIADILAIARLFLVLLFLSVLSEARCLISSTIGLRLYLHWYSRHYSWVGSCNLWHLLTSNYSLVCCNSFHLLTSTIKRIASSGRVITVVLTLALYRLISMWKIRRRFAARLKRPTSRISSVQNLIRTSASSPYSYSPCGKRKTKVWVRQIRALHRLHWVCGDVALPAAGNRRFLSSLLDLPVEGLSLWLADLFRTTLRLLGLRITLKSTQVLGTHNFLIFSICTSNHIHVNTSYARLL